MTTLKYLVCWSNVRPTTSRPLPRRETRLKYVITKAIHSNPTTWNITKKTASSLKVVPVCLPARQSVVLWCSPASLYRPESTPEPVFLLQVALYLPISPISAPRCLLPHLFPIKFFISSWPSIETPSKSTLLLLTENITCPDYESIRNLSECFHEVKPHLNKSGFMTC